MHRTIDNHLRIWSKRRNRKSLIIRGVRQVGKTYAVRKLGKEFENFFEINFDIDSNVKTFFNNSLNPEDIIQNLEYYYDIKIIPGKTLLFFDEIQECVNAIRSLRYFYEKMPKLHLIAAGSLLEFTLSEIPSFGVGRIEFINMYPMSFIEFIKAVKSDKTVELINNSSYENPVNQILHIQILEQLKVFQIIGGMPEVVQQYVNKKNIKSCQRILNILIRGYETDFAKYKKRSPVARLKETFVSVANQSGSKFKYVNVGKESSTLYKNSLELLTKAGLVYVVCHTSAQGIPLGATTNPRRFKTVLFDTGIYQRIMNLNLSEYITQDFKTIINKGVLAETFIANEIIKAHDPYDILNIYYWHREAKNSMAEVDYVIEKDNFVIPVEVKSGLGKKMKSMHIFLKEKNSPYGIRFSSDNFSKNGRIISIPLYAAETIKTPIIL